MEIRNLKKMEKADFEELWNEMDHNDFWSQSDVDEAVELFVHKIHTCLNVLAPLRKVVIRSNQAPYMTPNLLSKIKERKQLWKIYSTSGLPEDLVKFKKFRNHL